MNTNQTINNSLKTLDIESIDASDALLDAYDTQLDYDNALLSDNNNSVFFVRQRATALLDRFLNKADHFAGTKLADNYLAAANICRSLIR